MKTKISESGLIGTDGKMRLPMDRLNEFFAAHAGKRIIMTIEAVVPGTSAAQLAYYYKYIVPTIQAALYETGERKTDKQTDMWLREQFPSIFETFIPGQMVEDIITDFRDGPVYRRKYKQPDCIETKSIHDLTQSEMADYIEAIKQFAAENLYVYIEDPKTI